MRERGGKKKSGFPPKKKKTTRVWLHLDGLVGAGDEGDEEAEDHVDEEADEGVQVDLAEEPHQVAVLLHFGEGNEHIVPVDEGEEALGHHGKGSELGWEVTKGW